MKKLILKNFWVKVFCIFAASLLWVYVAAGQNSVGKYPGSVKIKAINVASGLAASYDNQNVEIKITAEPAVWNKLSIDSFSAYVDLSNKAEGTYQVPVNVVCSVPGVQIVEKSPDQIFVNLEKIVTKEVSVNKKIEGSAGDGLTVGAVTFTPDKVTIQGSKSAVESINEAYIDIKLNGETENFTKLYSLVAYDDKNNAIQDVTFNPAQISAEVSIVKASNNKTVGVRVVTSGLPKTGYYISSITANPAVVDVTGPVSVISSLNYIETTKIDITNLSSNTDLTTTLNPPSGILLQTGTSNSVKVHLELSMVDISKELTLSFNPINLPSSYEISSYNPSSVKVICSGPADLINSLKSSDVVFNLDFSDKKLPDAHNNISFDILPNNIQVKSGITVASVVPSAITVTVDRK